VTAEPRTPFNPRTALTIILVGFLAFLALLYFIGIGDTGGSDKNGQAHAASPGLNGFAGLARLLELEGYDVELSRSPSGLETSGLLVLTPPATMDAEDFAAVLEGRIDKGPTLVILPKWFAIGFPDNMPDEIEDQVEEGWVRLVSAQMPQWAEELPSPYTIQIVAEPHVDDNAEDFGESANPLDAFTGARQGVGTSWRGFGVSGKLPDERQLWAKSGDDFDTLLTNGAGNAMVLEILGEEGSEFYNNAHSVIIVVEPDLLNNYGLADQANADLADEIFQAAGYYEKMPVVFDLTLNGLGGTTNLLTLAFRPPFLAATLCLMLALLIVGWRAFLRFGPPVAERPAMAFGKQTLIANGAGLVVKARRTGLLAAPYVALSARRIQKTLALPRHDEAMLDDAIAARLPDDPGFSNRAATLNAASRPIDILRAARALHELERKLKQ
jgi:hypothetical protein